MKSLNKLLGLCLTALLLILTNPAKTLAQPGYSVSYQTFYDELQAYGTWVDDPDYGNVWIPDADEGFRPYATRGHWVVTPYGNTWVSDYPWGWATFHYGRWRFDDYYGWEWIPGNEWGPAWVNWRSGGGYYAWAPLGPSISIDISFGSGYRVPNDYWVCAPQAYIGRPNIYDYYVPRTRVVNIIHNTTIINNVYVNNNTRYVTGPRPHEIEQVTHNRVPVYNINTVNSPRNMGVRNNTVNVYRPTIVSTHNGNRPSPATVVDATAYKNAHPNERIANRAAGATIRPDNAAKLSQTARNPNPDNNVVRVNRPSNNRGNTVSPQQRQQQAQPQADQQRQQRQQQADQQRQQRQQQADQQRQQRQQQAQPQQQQIDQQRQQRQQQAQPQQQQTDQQRQQVDQQRQQRQQQAQPQQQQQMDQQRQQRQQQARPQQQQADQQRQQAQQQQQVQQQRQQQAQQQQQQRQQRQQQPQQQQAPQQRQQPQPEQKAQPDQQPQSKDRRSGERPTN